MPIIHVYKSSQLSSTDGADITKAIATFLGIDETDLALFYIESSISDSSSYLVHIEIIIPTCWAQDKTRELLIIASRFICNGLEIDESKAITTLEHIRMGDILDRGKIIE